MRTYEVAKEDIAKEMEGKKRCMERDYQETSQAKEKKGEKNWKNLER